MLPSALDPILHRLARSRPAVVLLVEERDRVLWVLLTSHAPRGVLTDLPTLLEEAAPALMERLAQTPAPGWVAVPPAALRLCAVAGWGHSLDGLTDPHPHAFAAALAHALALKHPTGRPIVAQSVHLDGHPSPEVYLTARLHAALNRLDEQELLLVEAAHRHALERKERLVLHRELLDTQAELRRALARHMELSAALDELRQENALLWELRPDASATLTPCAARAPLPH